MKRAKMASATGDAGVVGSVLMKYHAEYNRWPGFYREEEAGGNGHFTDLRWVTVMSPPPAAPGEVPSPDNMKRIPLFEPSGGSLGVATLPNGSANPHAGAFVDPWGNPFEYRVDADRNEEIPDPETDTAVRARVLVWSAGQDGDHDTWEDNVKGWE